MSAKSASTYKRRKRERIRQIKLDRGCEECGARPRNPQRLHFHHRDPSQKLFNISKNAHNLGWAKLATEIAKCAVVCEPCHCRLEGYRGGNEI